MQDSARQDTQCFLFYHSVAGRYPISFVTRLCPVSRTYHGVLYHGMDSQKVKEKGNGLMSFLFRFWLGNWDIFCAVTNGYHDGYREIWESHISGLG